MADGAPDRETVLIYAAAVTTLLGTSTVIIGLLVSDAPPAETWAAGAGWFTAAVTLYAAALVRDTLVTTRRALDEASRATTAAEGAIREQKRIGEAQVRAYLTAAKLELHVSMSFVGNAPSADGEWERAFPSGQPGLFDVTVYLSNHGQSPALNARIVSGTLNVIYGADGAKRYAALVSQGAVNMVQNRPQTVSSAETGSACTTFIDAAEEYEAVSSYEMSIDGEVSIAWNDVFGQEWFLTSEVDYRGERLTEDVPSVTLPLRVGPPKPVSEEDRRRFGEAERASLRRLRRPDGVGADQ